MSVYTDTSIHLPEDSRAAEEAKARRALGRQILLVAERLIVDWNARQESYADAIFVDEPLSDLELATEFARAEKAEATRRAHRGDFDAFQACGATDWGIAPLPAAAETVAAFLAV
jgi:hypothetical protein